MKGHAQRGPYFYGLKLLRMRCIPSGNSLKTFYCACEFCPSVFVFFLSEGNVSLQGKEMNIKFISFYSDFGVMVIL